MNYIPNPVTDCFVFFADNPSPAAIDFTAKTFTLKDSRFLHNEGATFFFRFPTAAQRNKFLRDYRASLERNQCTATVVRPELMGTKPTAGLRPRL